MSVLYEQPFYVDPRNPFEGSDFNPTPEHPLGTDPTGLALQSAIEDWRSNNIISSHMFQIPSSPLVSVYSTQSRIGSSFQPGSQTATPQSLKASLLLNSLLGSGTFGPQTFPRSRTASIPSGYTEADILPDDLFHGSLERDTIENIESDQSPVISQAEQTLLKIIQGYESLDANSLRVASDRFYIPDEERQTINEAYGREWARETVKNSPLSATELISRLSTKGGGEAYSAWQEYKSWRDTKIRSEAASTADRSHTWSRPTGLSPRWY